MGYTFNLQTIYDKWLAWDGLSVFWEGGIEEREPGGYHLAKEKTTRHIIRSCPLFSR